MKRIKPSLTEDEASMRMFFNEARLSARLNHPNIVQVFDVELYQSLPVIIMEYLEGISFDALRRAALRAGCWNPGIGLAILSEALVGLHHAHEAVDYDGTPLGLVHRDFKPSNIFITYDGSVKILDFGIAKAFGHSVQTSPGGVRGTIRYMAPETLRRQEVDRRVDLYAAGIMFWEVMAGRRMWQGVADIDVARHVGEGQIPSIRDVDGITEELAQLYERATSTESTDRFDTALEIKHELDNCRREGDLWTSMSSIAILTRALFANRRQRIRSIVNRQVKRLEAHPEGFTEGAPPPLPVPSERTDESPRSEPADDFRSRRGQRFAAWTLLFFATLAVGNLAAWWWFVRQPEVVLAPTPVVAPKQVQPADTAPPPDPPPPPSQPTEVTITVTARPAYAQWSMGDSVLPSNPAILKRSYDTSVHELTARADGYEPRTLRVVFVKDLDLDIELQRQAPDSVPDPPEPSSPSRPDQQEGTAAQRERPKPRRRKIFDSIDWSGGEERTGRKLQPTPYDKEEDE